MREGKPLPPTVTGSDGETAAIEYLVAHGYTVLHRNFRAFHGEIDIIAKKEPYIVFVEVKTRAITSDPRFGRPSAAVTRKKRYLLNRTAQAYIASHPGDHYYRFDVIEVQWHRDRDGGEKRYELNHMKGVFGAGGKIWI